MVIVAVAVSGAFVGLAIWHFIMVLSPRPRESGAVPHVDGRPLFVPSAVATASVGVCLLLCALLVAATAGLVAVAAPSRLLKGLSYALSLGLLARAIGDFRHMGFFK